MQTKLKYTPLTPVIQCRVIQTWNVKHKLTKSEVKGLSPSRLCHSSHWWWQYTIVYMSYRTSDSMLMITRLTSHSWVMDVQRRFSVSLSLETERSAIQLVAIKTKAIWWDWETLGPTLNLALITALYHIYCILLSTLVDSTTFNSEKLHWRRNSKLILL